ncbi:MAG: acyl-CoA thioesterase [Saprospiraceae bacterium]|nr:acyl-CoA thioesterase [Saprospiraceae bacterium]
MSDIETRIQQSQTKIFKAVFPNTTNHYHTLFGGTAMSLMDEVAFITATRFSKKRMVTVSTGKIDFTKPIPAGTIIELVGTVVRVGRTSLDVEIQVIVEEMYAEKRDKAIVGLFTMVAVDDERKPIPLLG